jgi:hypothetical protein
MSLPDFMSLAEEPAPVPDPVAGDVPEVLLPLPLGLAEGVLLFVSVLLDGVLVSVLEPLPPVGLPPLLAPAPDDDPLAAPLPEPVAPPAPPLWANADVASIAPATVSASALIHVFISVLLMLML